MRTRVLFLLLGIMLIVICFIYLNQTVQIETRLVDVRKNISKTKLEFPYAVATSKLEMNHILFEWLRDSLSEGVDLAFLENDYLITFGKPLKEARYYQHIAHPDDGCRYLPKLPLMVCYQNKTTDSIYFYKINKNKYRGLCGP